MGQRSVCTFLAGVPDYDIEDGNMRISAGDWCICMSLRNFQRGMAKAQRTIAEHYAREAEILPIRREG